MPARNDEGKCRVFNISSRFSVLSERSQEDYSVACPTL